MNYDKSGAFVAVTHSDLRDPLKARLIRSRLAEPGNSDTFESLAASHAAKEWLLNNGFFTNPEGTWTKSYRGETMLAHIEQIDDTCRINIKHA